MTRKARGEAPKRLTGHMPVSPLDSPWWDRVMSEMTRDGGLVGKTLSIEELTQMVPSYEGGGRPRARTVARRLRPILELVSRGPNGSLGRGATYTVRVPVADPGPETTRPDIPIDEIAPATDWLEQAVRRMTKEE